MDIESSSGSSGDEIDDEKEKVSALVQSDDDCSGNESGSDSDDEFEAPSYDDLVKLLNSYTKIIRKTTAKNERLELENESLLAKYDIAEKASVELRDENKVMSSNLKELKTSLKELKEKHDKLERIHKELNTRYDLLKDEYTTLKVNHDNLVISHEYLSNETHDATNNVVKIDIATSCDDLIDESIEQGSSSKGKKIVVANHYDDYIKIKNENEKLNKDLEKLSTNNTIVTETQDSDYDMALDIKMLREDNKILKIEKTHLATSLEKFTRGHNLQSELLMNTVMKNDKSGIGFKANKEKKAKAQYQHQHQHKPKPKPKRCIECGQEGHFAHECETLPPQPLPKYARPFAYNAHYSKAYHVEETYDMKFDESNGSKGAHENPDDVGEEPLRESMKNMLVGAIKPKDDEDEVQVIDKPSSSKVPQDDGKDVKETNEDIYVSHDQTVAQAQDIDAPQPPPQVVERRTTPLLQSHPQDLIIGSPSRV
ncbi:SWI5-dependent HO expression protein 3-like [Miscanthus floridulus]|uniref:SWI5-dependent HO expression protein 3-like n=1 Tax=Miscanthus floridulus TaxID=154761 RepID=UPI00345921B8